MEDIEIADVVAHEDMVGKDLEQVYSGDLFFILGATVKDDVLAVD